MGMYTTYRLNLNGKLKVDDNPIMYRWLNLQNSRNVRAGKALLYAYLIMFPVRIFLTNL